MNGLSPVMRRVLEQMAKGCRVVTVFTDPPASDPFQAPRASCSFFGADEPNWSPRYTTMIALSERGLIRDTGDGIYEIASNSGAD